MNRWIAIRLLEAVIAIWGAVTIVFVVTRLLGDPSSLLVEPGATARQLAAVRARLGLDQPILTQYGHFILQLLHGDAGKSFQSGRGAFAIILEALPATLQLGLAAILIGIVVGGFLGTLAALRRGTIWEAVALLLALVGQATPMFWLGLMAILFFAVRLGLVPTGGYGTPIHLLLPALVLSVYTSATVARLFRFSVLDVLHEDYVRTARAKGLAPHTVLFWHILRNALVPVLTVTALMAGELLGGSVVTETVFSWPGIGQTIMQAINARDFPVAQAGILLTAILFVTVNLAADLLYGVVDPRIRLRGGKRA